MPNAVINNQVDAMNAEKKLEESSSCVSKLMDCFDQNVFESMSKFVLKYCQYICLTVLIWIVVPLDVVDIADQVEVENEGNELEESSGNKILGYTINSPVPHTMISSLSDSPRNNLDNLEYVKVFYIKNY